MVKHKHKSKKSHSARRSAHAALREKEDPFTKLVPKFNKGENLTNEKGIALDFAARVYKKFNRIIKSVILFGSTAKNTSTPESDIDIFIIVDDAAIIWDQELIAWYREELAQLVSEKTYTKGLHINTTKLTTWWADMIRGDPVVINILRYGEALIDFGGFFNPLKVLLQQGRIKSTPEAIFTALERAPAHLSRSHAAVLGTVEGVYWCMVDSAHAALMAARKLPPSPEHVPVMLKETFVDSKMLDMKYIVWYRNLFDLHRRIVHGTQTQIKGSEIEEWQAKGEAFMNEMIKLVKTLVEDNRGQK